MVQTEDAPMMGVVAASEAKPTPAEQKEVIKQLSADNSMQKGDVWCLLNPRWYRLWTGYVGYNHSLLNTSNVEPQEMDCSQLIGADGKLKPHLMESIDYELVSKPVFEKLVAWYGGGPRLERKVITVGRNRTLAVEVYPLVLKVICSNTPTISQPFEISKAATVAEFKTMVCEKLDLKEDDCRLWNYYNQIRYSLLENDADSLEDARLVAQQYVLCEVKGPDGQFPPTASTTAITTYDSGASAGSTYTSSQPSIYSSTYSSGSGGGYYNSMYQTPSQNTYSYGAYGNTGRTYQKGCMGLSNLGNTCFMNSALQCLSNTPPLTNFLLSGRYEKDVNYKNPLGMEGKVALAYAELVKMLWSGQAPATTPHNFKYTIGKFAPRFVGYAQQDSQELLAFLLDGLHEDLNRRLVKPAVPSVEGGERPDAEVAAEAWEGHLKRNDSIIVDLFQGQFKSTVECPLATCGKISITFDPFMYLSLPLPDKTSKSLPVYFVYADFSRRPVKFIAPVDKRGTAASLKKVMSELTGVAVDCITMTEVYQNKFLKTFTDRDQLEDIREDDLIYLYEVASANDNDNVSVPVLGRTMETITTTYNRGYGLGTYTSSYVSVSLIGVPYFVTVPRNTTRAHIEAVVRDSMKRFVIFEEAGPAPVPMQQDAGAGAAAEPMATESTTTTTAEAAAPTDTRQAVETATEPMDTTVPRTQEEEGQEMNEYVEIPKEHGSNSSDSNEGEPYWNDTNIPTITAAPVVPAAAASGETNEDEDAAVDPETAPLYTLLWVNSQGRDMENFPADVNAAMQIRNYSTIGVDFNKVKFERCYDKAKAEEFDLHETAKVTEGKDGKDSLTLDHCLDLFATKEKLSAEDAWYCPKCQEHREAFKKFDIWRAPSILVIHLKRFSYTRYWRDKLDTFVDFPVEGFDISKHLVGPTNGPQLYDLFAISNHYGGMGGGHYTAYAKNQFDNEWYSFDDSSCSKTDVGNIKTTAAYLLFYKRRGDVHEDAPAPGDSAASVTTDTDTATTTTADDV